MTAGTTQVCLAIGSGHNSPTEESVNVVTGVVVLTTEDYVACGSLPDIWFPFQITLGAGFTAGSISQTICTYELEST
jgi:hypothetical protein